VATVAETITSVRLLLAQPEPSTPSEAVILEVVLNQLQHHHNQLQSTSNHFSVDSYALDATSGTEDYIVSAANFGRPFLVHTEDADDTYHHRREVPFSLLQDADQLYRGPQQTHSAYEWTAQEIIFYRRSNAWYARLVPIPGASGSYRVWFEVALANPGALTETHGLAAFHNLVKVQSALSLLPHCRWSGLDAKDTLAQGQMLERALLRDEAKYQRAFDHYRANSTREGVSDRIGYGGLDYEAGDGYDGFSQITWGRS